MNRSPRPVLIDTDTGVDDALALMLAFHSPELSVRAITPVAGNAPVDRCTRNVRGLLQVLHPATVPEVGRGASRPLRRALTTAPEVHGTDGLGGISATLPAARVPVVDGVDLILRMSQRYGRLLTIIALGPLTNLARALRRKPDVFRRVGRIVSMGGAFSVPGNTGPVAEFNVFVDPDAAAEVYGSGIPITIVPLDVTEQCRFTRDELRTLAPGRSPKISRLVLSLARGYMEYHRMTEGFVGGYLHDPLAVAVAAQPSLVRCEPSRVVVERDGHSLRGMTSKVGVRRSSVEVAVQVNRTRFRRLFHSRLLP